MILNTSGIVPTGLTGPITFFVALTDIETTDPMIGIYCVDTNSVMIKINTQEPNLGSIQSPGQLSQDTSGNIYFIERSDNNIYKTNISDGTTTQFITYGLSGFSDVTPGGIAVDSSGTVYLSDTTSHCILVFPVSLEPYVLAGGESEGYQDGSGNLAQFSYPAGIVLDGSGNLYVADRNNARIRKINIETGEVTTFAGTSGTEEIDGPLLNSVFLQPQFISYDGNGKFYISASEEKSPIPNIRMIYQGQVTTINPSGSMGKKTLGYSFVVGNPTGTIYSLYRTDHQLYIINYVQITYELLCEGASNSNDANWANQFFYNVLRDEQIMSC
jgi:hypothetical protein